MVRFTVVVRHSGAFTVFSGLSGFAIEESFYYFVVWKLFLYPFSSILYNSRPFFYCQIGKACDSEST